MIKWLKLYAVIFVSVILADGTGVFAQDVLEINLNQAVELSLNKNIDLENNSLDVKLSESTYRISRSAYNPVLSVSSDSTWDDSGTTDDSSLDHQVNVSLSKAFSTTGATLSLYSNLYRYDDSKNSSQLTQGDSGRYSNTMGLSLDQPLLKNLGFWSDRLALKQSRLTLDNAQTEFHLSRQRLILDVISKYFTALKQMKLVEVGEKGVEDAQRHLVHSRIKMEEGLVAQMDVSQAELQLARQQTSLIRTRQSAASSLDSLKLKLNIPLSQTLVLTEEVDNLAESLDEKALVDEALSCRLELQTLENDIAKSRMSIKQSMNQRLPAIDFQVNAEMNHRDDDMSETYNIEDEDYSFSVGFSWSVGNRSDRETWVQNRILLKKLENRMKFRKQSIEKEVLDEIRNCRSLVEALNVSEKAVDIAERALVLATTSYQEGLTSNLDLLKSQDDLVNARNDYYSNLMDLVVSKARILNAIGREINPENLVVNSEK